MLRDPEGLPRSGGFPGHPGLDIQQRHCEGEQSTPREAFNGQTYRWATSLCPSSTGQNVITCPRLIQGLGSADPGQPGCVPAGWKEAGPCRHDKVGI